MIKKVIGLFCITIILPMVLPGQIMFERYWGGSLDDRGFCVHQTSDGGYIIAGRDGSQGAFYNAWLIKTDSLGDTLWTKIYDWGVSFGIDAASCVKPTMDGGYIITGIVSPLSNNYDVLLMKTDSNGDTIWTKIYGVAGSGKNDYGEKLAQTLDGGYIIVGYTSSFGAGGLDVWLLKTDANGDTLWTKTYGGSSNDYGFDVRPIADGYIIAGITASFGAGGLDGYLIRTDLNGNLVWAKTYGGTDTDDFRSIALTPDGGYVMVGYTGSYGEMSNVYLVRTDTNGDTLWTKTYGGASTDYGSDIKNAADGGYIIVGQTYSYGVGGDVFLIKTDSNNEPEWMRTFGGAAGEDGKCVQQTSDGGYIITGWTPSYGAGNRDAYLIKTDANGNSIFSPDISTSPNQLVFDYSTKIYVNTICPSKFKLYSSLIDPILSQKIERASSEELMPVIIIMEEQLDSDILYKHASNLSKTERRKWVCEQLKAISQRTQQGVISYLKTEQTNGNAKKIQPLWLINAIACQVTKDIILKLTTMPGIGHVSYDGNYFHSLGMPSRLDVKSDRLSMSWGVEKIRAPQVWTLGYTGKGIIVGHLDTGVNYNHLDLADHMWDGNPIYPNHGWDFVNSDNDPLDDNGHGSHTAGTIAGDGTSYYITGVAPDAQIMAIKVLDALGTGSFSNLADGVQFAIDQGAHLISMSLGAANPTDDLKDFCRDMCNTVYAVDIPMAISAGNGVPGSPGTHFPAPYDIYTPADVPAPWYGSAGHSAAIAVGATGVFEDIADFSSYGSTEWNTPSYTDYPYPPGLLKPDVSAPGIMIISLVYYNNFGYTTLSGTSMAAPHLAGTIALMLEKNPLLISREIDSIVEVTSVDLAIPGRDSLYGAGRIDASSSVLAVSAPSLKKGVFRILNEASATKNLDIYNITWSAPWIKDVTPTSSFTVGVGDSMGINVYVELVDLAPGTYWDTLWIYSNDPDENPYPEPICLIVPIVGIEEKEKSAQLSPTVNGLLQISPNPFKEKTEIRLQSVSIEQRAKGIELKIYDVSGRLVKDFSCTQLNTPRLSHVSWDGTDEQGKRVPAGIYFVRLGAEGHKQTQKVVFLR